MLKSHETALVFFVLFCHWSKSTAQSVFSTNCYWKGFLRCPFLCSRANLWLQYIFKATQTHSFAPAKHISQCCCTLKLMDMIHSCRGLGLCILASCLSSLHEVTQGERQGLAEPTLLCTDCSSVTHCSAQSELLPLCLPWA